MLSRTTDIVAEGGWRAQGRRLRRRFRPSLAEGEQPLYVLTGGGEKVTLKLVARFGDACIVAGDIDTLKHKFES